MHLRRDRPDPFAEQRVELERQQKVAADDLFLSGQILDLSRSDDPDALVVARVAAALSEHALVSERPQVIHLALGGDGPSFVLHYHGDEARIEVDGEAVSLPDWLYAVRAELHGTAL